MSIEAIQQEANNVVRSKVVSEISHAIGCNCMRCRGDGNSWAFWYASTQEEEKVDKSVLHEIKTEAWAALGDRHKKRDQ